MKKLFFITAILFSASIAFSQYVPGTAIDGSRGTNGTLTNGLTSIFTVSGRYTLSADGAGSNATSYSISVDKPNAQATVYKAYLMGTPIWSHGIADNCISLAGASIAWDASVGNSIGGGTNYYKDVTSIVTPIINPAAPGINTLTVSECSTSYIDGVALLVVFADPAADTVTINILWGALSTAGDNFSITLANPIDPNNSNSVLDMGLGIGFGYQESFFNQQYSILDVNGTRMSTSAGGSDDGLGTPENGQLITVGGIGDVNTNPPDPYALPNGNRRYDDELYDLLPFINASTTYINIGVSNPSNDDNVFLAYFVVSGEAVFNNPPPQPVPVSPWALVFGIFLIGVFMVVRYRRRLA